MAAKWTKDQQKVIDARNCNLLVSAAAGSGKTAVLVERIIKRVMDPETPVDIDEMLVVTFTSAAASEMRERIRTALENALEQDPENPHLLRQITLVHNAQITTIHSFCLNVIRNHFQEIDLDPAFRIADEGETKLLAADAMDQLMARHYETEPSDSPFFALIEAYGRGGRDTAVTEMIEDLYRKSQSYPWPVSWLHQLVDAYSVTDEKALGESSWMQFVAAFVKKQIADARKQTEELLNLCLRPDGPACYANGLKKDLELYDSFVVAETYQDLKQRFSGLKYGAIGNSRGYTGDPELLDYVKEMRDANKKCIMKLADDYFSGDTAEVLTDLAYQKPYMEELVLLTEEFLQEFSRMKRSRNLVDYNDLEHLALEILVDEETGQARPAAVEYRRQFKEIMTDEYQDSNRIQETLLESISREGMGEHNRFMVGDVKQSIYRFRMACPEIFMEKYHSYEDDGEANRRIDLHMNFRSRREVLDFANDICFPLMQQDLGGVAYDDKVALYAGSESYILQPGMFDPEILVGDCGEEEAEERIYLEAKMTADKILQMKKDQMVTEPSDGSLRPMRFSDVVILMRSPGSGGDIFAEVLQENGIPAFMESRTGYFSSVEVETVLSLLKILDNPLQDIPLAAVLHSPMFGFDDGELARIRGDRSGSFAEALFIYQQNHPEDEKTAAFLSFLSDMREKVADTPIHVLLEEVLDKTGYLRYVTAMPGGANRRANLEKLMDQAVTYESTSYKGLFHFVKYIENLQKYEVDFGTAEIISENDDAVRIMSIHKSKGLEFPVVFISGLGRQFNRQDSRGRMIVHGEYGVGLEYVDPDRRIKKPSLYKKAVADAINEETLGEELRVLYVALTRAKEKLVLTGVCKEPDKVLLRWKQERGPAVPFTRRLRAESFLEWIVRATAVYGDKYPIRVVREQELVARDVAEGLERRTRMEQLQEASDHPDTQLLQQMTEQLSYRYPYDHEKGYKTKYSVSEIKHQAMEAFFEEEQKGHELFEMEEEESYIPSFIAKRQQQKVSPGALRGTAAHRALECFDFSVEDPAVSLEEQLQLMMEKGLLTEEQRQLISVRKLRTFLESPIAQRMHDAAKKKKLYLERAFVMGEHPKELFGDSAPEWEGENLILVQGIIDVFFEEEDGIVLLDYKTDRVDAPEELIGRYQRQLQLYRDAIQRTSQKDVKEMYLYSFALEETILV